MVINPVHYPSLVNVILHNIPYTQVLRTLYKYLKRMLK